MIYEIVGMICKEARTRQGKSLVPNIIDVMFEVNGKLLDILDILRSNERRLKRDEDKRTDFRSIP